VFLALLIHLSGLTKSQVKVESKTRELMELMKSKEKNKKSDFIHRANMKTTYIAWDLLCTKIPHNIRDEIQ